MDDAVRAQAGADRRRSSVFTPTGVFVLVTCVVLRGVQAHPVEQIFATLDQDGDAWNVEVLFDAAFALPEFRDDSDAPAPKRSWLLERSAEEHERIRRGAREYLRERIRFFLGEEQLAWEASFPDYEQTPPAFPKLLNGGAYVRVNMRGELGGGGGELALEMSGGPGPNFVVAIGAEGEPRYVTVSPDQRVALFDVASRTAGGGADYWLIAGGGFAVLAVFGFARVIRRRASRRSA